MPSIDAISAFVFPVADMMSWSNSPGWIGHWFGSRTAGYAVIAWLRNSSVASAHTSRWQMKRGVCPIVRKIRPSANRYLDSRVLDIRLLVLRLERRIAHPPFFEFLNPRHGFRPSRQPLCAKSGAYSAAPKYSVTGGHEQTRLRSPATLSMRDTGGQYFATVAGSPAG
jgi:hypothetical protein